MAGVKPETTNTKADAWRTTSRVLARRHPAFPLAGEVARRIADHHEARLPAGWESVPIVQPEEPQP